MISVKKAVNRLQKRGQHTSSTPVVSPLALIKHTHLQRHQRMFGLLLLSLDHMINQRNSEFRGTVHRVGVAVLTEATQSISINQYIFKVLGTNWGPTDKSLVQ